MNGRALLLVLAVAGLVGPGAGLVRAAETPPPGYRLRNLDDAKTRASVPFPITGTSQCATFPGIPQVVGADFDPSKIDEIAVGANGRAVAWATTLSEAGVPGATRDIAIFREGGIDRVRASDANGDNDQPSLDYDRFGLRMTFRGSDGARGTTTGNVYLRSTSRKPPASGTDGASESTEEVKTVKLTTLVSTTTDAHFGTAWDPTLAARTRVRDAGSGVKVEERDARVAFCSTGDLETGRNEAHRPQLFVWREQSEDFVQLTSISADGFTVARPSISAGGQRIAFESNADLTPEAADPKDPSRVGNPSKVRQVYLWEAGRGIRQLTWSDRDCLAPRIARDGRHVLFCSRGEPIEGGNPEGNFEIFAWVDGRDASRRLRQVTRTTQGDSVLPRPTTSASTFTFWSTVSPPSGGSGFGSGAAQCAPLAYLAKRGRIVRVGGLSDVENLQRIGDSPDPTAPENPVVAGPPCPGTDASKIHFVTNDPRLNEPGADDDLDGDDGEGDEPDDRAVDASAFLLHVARVTSHVR